MIKRDIPKFDTVLLHYWSNLRRNSNRHKRVELWTKSINFVNLGGHFPCATSAKNPRSMYARVPQAMAQFVLKIEKLSHIMGPTPILEMARAYGLRPRLWLLVLIIIIHSKYFSVSVWLEPHAKFTITSCCSRNLERIFAILNQ